MACEQTGMANEAAEYGIRNACHGRQHGRRRHSNPANIHQRRHTHTLRHSVFNRTVPLLLHGMRPRIGKRMEASASAEASEELCCAARYLAASTLAYLRRNRSTRPAVSISFCFPVKNG